MLTVNTLNNRKIKIGIITHYYKSHNYGGTLQAYALCRFLNDNGYDAEQICYNNYYVQNNDLKKEIVRKKNIILKIFNPFILFRHFKSKVNRFFMRKKQKKLNARFVAFLKFQETIPHSEKVYNKNNINVICNDYDFFITGSDQVWNTDWFGGAYFLDFVKDGCKKISYAASVGTSNFNDEQKKIFKQYLADFKAISVREKSARDLIENAIGRSDIQWTLDPTLLLKRSDWDEISSDRIIKEKYIFCYFFGEDLKSKEVIKQYAKSKKLKIVNIPFLLDNVKNKTDQCFGDYRLIKTSPNDFISLIKYAECVFTNSFHACVFSCIYNKNFFVFNRLDKSKMNDRIYSLCELFECTNHFCDDEDKKTIDYVDNLTEIDYKKFFKVFQLIKEQSVAFLKNNLV